MLLQETATYAVKLYEGLLKLHGRPLRVQFGKPTARSTVGAAAQRGASVTPGPEDREQRGGGAAPPPPEPAQLGFVHDGTPHMQYGRAPGTDPLPRWVDGLPADKAVHVSMARVVRGRLAGMQQVHKRRLKIARPPA